MFGGLFKELPIGSCYRIVVLSLPISTVNNWMVSHKNSRPSKIRFTFYMITQDHMLQNRPERKIIGGTIRHPSYSPDLAPANYHLFRSFSNHLHEKKFNDKSNLKTNLANFFSQKFLDFYERRIFSLRER